MYILDKQKNSLLKADIRTFKELGLEERKHLQEWIAAEPSSLGEELLIIQKEFDGFADTKERLDLLAIDKQGCLVIIENKLDDSGKDVTWQTIKYASYCSSLKPSEIISIFQKYLGDKADAAETISEFMDDTPIDEIELNPDNSQRIFLVAANFRKEVTSSVLWLANFGIKIKCFKVTPYTFADRTFIDFDQIIPVKDTEDYTIKMTSKKQETAQSAESTALKRQRRLEFWHRFINYNKSVNGPFCTSNGSPDNWLGKSLGMSGIGTNVVINQSDIRVEISINLGDKVLNKKAFDFFFAHKDKIDSDLADYKVNWQRMDDKITSRINTENPGFSWLNPDDEAPIFKWLVKAATAYIKVFSAYTKKLKK